MTTINTGDLVTAAQINQWAPPGAVIDYVGETPPTGWVIADSSAVSRATYPEYLAAATFVRSGSQTNASAIITGLPATANLRVGMRVEGLNIPTNAQIASINSSSQITLSANATATIGSNPLTFFPYGNGNGSTTVGLPDGRGRGTVGWPVAGGHVDVGALGNNEGQASVAFRRPKHQTTSSGLSGTASGLSGTLPSHAHTNSTTLPSHTHTTNYGQSNLGSSGGDIVLSSGAGLSGSTTKTSGNPDQGAIATGGTIGAPTSFPSITVTGTVSVSGTVGTANANDPFDSSPYLVLNKIVRLKDL